MSLVLYLVKFAMQYVFDMDLQVFSNLFGKYLKGSVFGLFALVDELFDFTNVNFGQTDFDRFNFDRFDFDTFKFEINFEENFETCIICIIKYININDNTVLNHNFRPVLRTPIVNSYFSLKKIPRYMIWFYETKVYCFVT